MLLKGDGEFAVATDASDGGIGAALMQQQDGELVVLEFAAKALTDTQKNWATYTRKEAYAIRWAVERFEDYIRTGYTCVLTDHQALLWMRQAKTGKVRRWALYLQQFDLDIHHIKGDDNAAADWVSRAVLEEEDPYNDEDKIIVPAWNIQETSQIEEVDPEESSPTTRRTPYVSTREDLLEGIKAMPQEDIKQTYEAPDGLRYSVRTNRLYIPPTCRDLIMYWFHCSRYGGHCGINRTVRRLNKWVWWPRMSQQVREYIRNCLTCLRNAIPHRATTLSGVLSRPLPFHLVSLDVVGPRRVGQTKYYYLVMIDHASRFMVTHCWWHPHITEDVINIFETRWMQVFQLPS